MRTLLAAARDLRLRWRRDRVTRRIETARLRRRGNRATTYIGITGSYGKTTATALLGRILERGAPAVTCSHHNIFPSVVSTLLAVTDKHRFCVQEVGASVPGSIHEMAELLMPQVAIVTGVGMDHRQQFRTLDATAREKGALVEVIPLDGLAVLNADDPLVRQMATRSKGRVVYYGRGEGVDLKLLDAISDWPAGLRLQVAYRGQPFSVQTRLIGTHWATSVLAALLAALELGATLPDALAAIASFEPLFNRMSVYRTAGGTWHVADGSKASFSGMAACLSFLDEAQAPRKTVVFGSLADYPGSSRAHYARVARMIMNKADRAFFVGPNADRVRRLAEGEFKGRLFMLDDMRKAADAIGQDTIADEIVYVKSAGVDHLERVTISQFAPVECWVERCGKPRSCGSCRHLFGSPRRLFSTLERDLLARSDRGPEVPRAAPDRPS